MAMFDAQKSSNSKNSSENTIISKLQNVIARYP